MSDKKLKKQSKIFDNIFEKITKVNSIVDEYNKLGINPAIPGNAFINIANSMYTMGHFQEAENMLKNAVYLPTKTSNAFINLGILKQTTGNFQEALKFYESAFEKDKSNAKILGLWGNCLAVMGKQEEAIEKYKLATEIDDKNADVYLFWGALLIKQKQYDDAKEKLLLASEYNTKDVRPLYMTAIVEIETEQYDEALTKLLNIISVTEKNYEALHNIAYIYFKKKDYDLAISYAKKVLSIYRQKIETYLILGDIYTIKNMEKEALQFYEMAEMNGIKTFFLYISWGVSLQKFNKHEQAIEKFHKANECLKTKNVDEIYARLALSYLKTGNTILAEQNTQQALDINSHNYIANRVAAKAELSKKNYETAISYLEKCEDDFTNKGTTYSIMAQCYVGLGENEKAQQFYEKAIEYNPDNKEILTDYCNYLISQNEYEIAKKRVKSFLNNSDDTDILNLYFNILYKLAKQGGYNYNLEIAVKVAKKIIEKDSNLFLYKSELKEIEEFINNNG